jgi:ASC-1-like (ASCH) protein
MSNKYIKNVSEPWFSLMKIGKKKVEGRLNRGDFKNMKKGDIIEWQNDSLGFKRVFTTKIKRIRHYDNFKSYLIYESLEKTLPGIDNINDGLNIYYNIYNKNDENTYKVLAIKIKVYN